jgi:hypothetical protein
VLEPGAEVEVSAAETEAGDLGVRSEGDLLHLAGKLGRGALVGVEEEDDPGMLEGNCGESGVAVGREVVEGAAVDVGSGGEGDLHGVVGAVGVEDVDVVGPGDAGEAVGKVKLLVTGGDENGDHLLVMVSRDDLREVRGGV